MSLDANTKDDLPPVKLVADWKQGTIGSLIAAAHDGRRRAAAQDTVYRRLERRLSFRLQDGNRRDNLLGKGQGGLDGGRIGSWRATLLRKPADTTWPSIKAQF